MERDRNIQALRGLAAMLVVTLHAYNVLYFKARSSWIVAAIVPATQFGAMGVDLFFVISGAVMAMAIERDPRPGAFLSARFVRVVPLFWVSAVANFAVRVAGDDMPTPTALLNTLTILPIFDSGPVYSMPVPGVGWTLTFELWFYAIVAAALLLPKAARADAIAVVLLAGAAVGLMIVPITTPLLGVVCNPILIEFLLGFWAVRAARMAVVRTHGPLIAAAGAVLLTAGALHGYGFPSGPEAVIAAQTSLSRVLAWGLPSAMLVAGTIGRPAGRGLFLGRLGDASYAIYLVHNALFAVIAAAWVWTGPLGSDLLFGVLMASAALAGLAAHRWIERRLLARLRRRPTPRRLLADAVIA